jgi:hypothetical protein
LKKTTTQTVDKVAATLLKQIAWPAKKDHPYLKIIYENIEISDDRPSRDTILKLFIQCAQSIKIRILFDALDECSDDDLGKVYQLIETFREANIGVYVTTRPHIVDLLRKQKSFAGATYMENITADGVDINNFLERRIQEHREPIEADLMKDIVGTIGNAEGMYRPLN